MVRNAWLVPLMVFALVGIAPAPRATAEDQTSPEQASRFIQDLGSRTVTLLTAYHDNDARQLQQRLRDLIREGFDLDMISRFALGATWQTATPAQRQEYQALFAAWAVESYARQLGADKGGSLTVLGAQAGSEQLGPNTADAIVHTRLNRANGPSMDADLRVRDSAGRMKIVDVTMDGVSMDVTQRDEFASIIRRKGLTGLIGDLKARTDRPAVETARQ